MKPLEPIKNAPYERARRRARAKASHKTEYVFRQSQAIHSPSPPISHGCTVSFLPYFCRPFQKWMLNTVCVKESDSGIGIASHSAKNVQAAM